MTAFAPTPSTSVVSPEGFMPQVNQWVQLRDRISDYSDDQALLLCEEADGRWVAWVAGYGEVRLTREQMLKA